MESQSFLPGDPEPIDIHPWRRFVAIGDSFTEGVGDPEPNTASGVRGWADRVAEVLSQEIPNFSYANLAIRGKLIQQIYDEQLDAALQIKPDLISISAGGNDLLRPNADPDKISALFEEALQKLRRDNATVLVFTGVDVGFSPVFKHIRGKVAIYNENIHALAKKYDCVVADQWGLRELQDPRMWADDRLHLSPLGHHSVARMVLECLNVENDLEPLIPGPIPPSTWKQARVDDLIWAREYLVPWVLRRIRHTSSGDGVSAKRPEPMPVVINEGSEQLHKE
ncbi:MAG: SGNH/GDSL hydrolase family protein [Microbacteriaceae bacterium]